MSTISVPVGDTLQKTTVHEARKRLNGWAEIQIMSGNETKQQDNGQSSEMEFNKGSNLLEKNN